MHSFLLANLCKADLLSSHEVPEMDKVKVGGNEHCSVLHQFSSTFRQHLRINREREREKNRKTPIFSVHSSNLFSEICELCFGKFCVGVARDAVEGLGHW